ncbi:hypothetical protein CHS0354_027367 [Potamilus streckersoni]|uniref:Uncharacterized protein n=1 Tax=Potamilus streckersoni TaxID=2493646 RepID=A0AAE0SQB9_9BIVA|nr:hypothetical protein CHS0354_027367 [Potamilus streckersoni]
MKYQNIQEEELKNKIAKDYFGAYDCTQIVGRIDFSVTVKGVQEQYELGDTHYLLWAEAKRGKTDIHHALIQLILTVGKARTFDTAPPPPYLGAFDGEKIAFLPYNDIRDVFYLNDFNWNVTPSDRNSKEFSLLEQKVRDTLEDKSLLFYFDRDDKDIEGFIRQNFVPGKIGTTKIRIDKNNFTFIYFKWLDAVKPSIDKLFVLLKQDHYLLDRKFDASGLFHSSSAQFNDKQKAHTAFWNKYERPPKEEYWDYIVDRRDLLVPQDIRERKGSFYTPQIWVELSQKYLADTLGENWQDDYYVWDCAAGTGNLLNGLTNKYNLWASTLDKQEYDVMKDRIQNGFNLLEDHVFQFDFLNDDFDKLPAPLRQIIADPKKRRKLIIYINPPMRKRPQRQQDSAGTPAGQKNFYVYEKGKFMIDWLRQFYDKKSERIAYLRMLGTDMQHNQGVFFTLQPSENDLKKKLTADITKDNVMQMCIYLSMRHFTATTWLNDTDQFLYPNEGWQTDKEFQTDCLAYALFHGKNKISCRDGVNHWIPFTAATVNAREKFESDFMSRFIKGTLEADAADSAPEQLPVTADSAQGEPDVPAAAKTAGSEPLNFSPAAAAVFDAGRALWRYYHAQGGQPPRADVPFNVNAGLYDIREFFQGRNAKGRMNSGSPDETYTALIADLRLKLKVLAAQIEPKVYEYGFLKA